jgi:propionyl-CoA carboxylase alpha chain
MITSVLVANRGEIARRVFRTCRARGLATVAVYSDADADCPHVREADAAVRLPGDAPGDTYLRGDLVVDAAKRAGADAVHPGYGFLSEHADFARAVLDAGLSWIGPPPAAIETMASKIESKRLMAGAGVPVLSRLDPGRLTDADLPVLVKASAGGGGRGMRVVRSLAELGDQLAAAGAEAAAAFADPTVFCEPYLAAAHHVEVQIVADRHGTVWAVGERECSIQRRHQKVVEEAPSPLVDRTPGMREELYAAAVAAARATDYEGAGTVEFLADETGRFFFLEMNTRLQVEHPVTEVTTGLDLVGLQLDVTEGRRLPPEPPAARGWAVEARLYAEDPEREWRPQSGVVHRFHVPGGPGIRLDSGVEDGSPVSVFYDPMLAKVVAWAPERHDAVRALAGALTRAELHGPVTNRDLLVRVLRHPAFLAGTAGTEFLTGHELAALSRPLAEPDAVRLSALAAALADAALGRGTARVQGGLPGGWRNLPSQPQRKEFTGPGGPWGVDYRLGRDGLHAPDHPGVRLLTLTPDAVTLDVDGVRREFAVRRYDAAPDRLFVDSALGSVTFGHVDRFPDPSADVAPGSLVAPMPGVVVAVHVAVGDAVVAGRPLLVLEAMKMQHSINAPAAGTVTELPVDVGRHVDVGTVLAVVSDEPSSGHLDPKE